MKETDIQKAIMDYLAVLERQGKLMAFRSASGSFQKDGARFKTGRNGIPDISVILAPSGQYIGFEVKTPTGKLTAIQDACHDAIRRVGGRCYVVRSVDDVIRVMNGYLESEG